MAQQDKYYFADDNGETEHYSSSLKDFKEKDLDKIFQLFIQGTKITEIREQYPNISSSGLEGQLPWIITEEQCEKCESFLYAKYSRSTRAINSISRYLCRECGHEPNRLSCQCRYCVADLEKEKEALKKQYHHFLNEFYKLKPDLSRLDVFDEIYLFLILSEHRSFLSFTSFRLEATPHTIENRDYAILDKKTDQFIEQEILIPYMDNFLFWTNKTGDWIDAKVQPKDKDKTLWQLNLHSANEKLTIQGYFDYFTNREFSIQEKSIIWFELYKSEISAYIRQISEGVIRLPLDNFFFDLVTETMIEEFSLSKAFSFLYSAVKSTLYYQTKHKVNDEQAVSFFKDKINQYAREFAGSKAQKGFDRPHHSEDSLIHECIIKHVLKLDSSYFYLHTEEILPEYQSVYL